MADFVVRWNDFRGGDYGRLDASRANSNQFSGRNVVVYRSGLLGPRTGWKQMAVTGLPTHPTAASPAGLDVFTDKIVIALDKNYDFPMTAPASAATAYTAYPAGLAVDRVDFLRGDTDLYSLLGGRLFRHRARGLTEITLPQPLSIVVRWGMFMVGVDKNLPWRLWFSTVDASGPHFDQWGANNFVDVGNADPIVTLTPIYNTLYAGKPSGWWAVSGVLGVQASVREVVVGNGPVDHRFTSVTTDNRVIYWPVEQSPAWFNGERVYIDDMFTLDPRTLTGFPGHTTIVTPTGRTLLLCGEDSDTPGTDMMMWRDSAWYAHATPFALGALTPADVKAAAQMPQDIIYGVKRPAAPGEAVVVLSWDHGLDRPGHASDTWCAPKDHGANDLVLGAAALPAWFDGSGRQCRVRTVIVQFRKFPSGVTDSLNQLRCAVDALGEYQGGRVAVEGAQWNEPSSQADPAGLGGVTDSWRVNVGEQGWGNGFQIKFPVIRGVAIQEVIALVDVRTERT